jgi:pilus assembly protein CpaE
MRVLIASSDSRERNQVRHYLAEEADIEVTGLALDGQEAVQQALQLQPDVVILAADMPVLDGFRAAEMITLAVPSTVTLLLADAGSEAEMSRALRVGARGFLVHPFSRDELMKCLREVAALSGLRESDEFQRLTDLTRMPKTISVTGAKGGVGKTTIAVNPGGPWRTWSPWRPNWTRGWWRSRWRRTLRVSRCS